jgi:iron complex outermembrane receptor protein
VTKANRPINARLMCGAAAIAILAANSAYAADARYNIAPQPLDSALREFGVQSGVAIMADADVTFSKQSPGFSATAEPDAALRQILSGTGLSFKRDGDVFVIAQQGGGSGPQGGSVAGGGAEVEGLIVTAQKREEDIQDVPIAMSAFSQEALERSQIAGGPDLMTQIPNMTFTKTNFASYSIQIRGIGTQAISATTDAAVAVAFNNSSFIRNRFFEQEFYDLQRIEVLRGPQGTLYGRNATAGVVNVISAKPKFNFEAKASADVANYSSQRLEGMVNIPLVEDAVALRVAGAWTKRDGYSTNQLTGNAIDGRDLWSARVSLRFAPNDRIDANLIWEHFEEDDDRLRSGKQLCKTDDRAEINGVPRVPGTNGSYSAMYSQGCIPESLYAPESFQVPDGYSLPFYLPLAGLSVPIFPGKNPYAGTTQSRDLRVIESMVDPQYRAQTDLGELQINIDVTDDLTLTSETAYSTDDLFSTQDYNRFNTAPGAFNQAAYDATAFGGHALNNGIFCDPQIGCSDRLVLVDLSTAKSKQFSQELRLSSDFDGPFNFSLGGNFLRYDTEDKYYVFINTLSLYAVMRGAGGSYVPGVTDNSACMPFTPTPPDVNSFESLADCIPVDPNPITNLNDQGHNYFLSRNPYKLISYAAFGEAYYNITPDLKLTGGLRLTIDKKEAPRIPSWLLASNTVGLPIAEVIEQEWREPTGRVALDWKPHLAFTNETLLYASFAHGYKAGGANPPAAGVVVWEGIGNEVSQGSADQSATQPKTFAPEFVDAYEIGAKNTLLDGRLTLNMGAFYYDYEGYQISYIVNRSAVNLNFDAEIWGLELEADWRPLENLKLGFKGGYENTRMADGSRAIDVMDRTAGDPNWLVSRPFPSLPSNCIVPMSIATNNTSTTLTSRPNTLLGGAPGACEHAYLSGLDPVTLRPYVPNPTIWKSGGGPIETMPADWLGYEGFDPTTAPNGGEGIYKDLSGNELPNAPHFTATVTADYTAPLRGDWTLTLHSDLYYQSEAWTRVFNTEGYDKLKAYTNVNLAAIFANEDAGWKIMAYVKNVMDRDSITGAFLNSDDSGLTTNVFLTEPRLYGIRVTKDWTGGSLLGGFGGRRQAGQAYPFTLEVGGQAQRYDASTSDSNPGFINSFSSAIDPSHDQNFDLDRGDGREVKFTYNAGDWKAWLGARFGKTNGSSVGVFRSEPGNSGCQSSKYVAPNFCVTNPANLVTTTNWSQSGHRQKEEHTIVNFAAGRDIGMGLFEASTLSVGLRYADLNSAQDISLYGISHWDVPTGTVVSQTGHRHRLSAHADHGFEGVGPVVSWDASKLLIGDDDAGHLDIDWSVTAGALFGDQDTSIQGEERAETILFSLVSLGEVTTMATPVAIQRSSSRTVPVVDVSLGLSYTVNRAKISAGYRWERYFNAIDGGYDETQQYDRTIDGPYLTLAIGFGG